MAVEMTHRLERRMSRQKQKKTKIKASVAQSTRKPLGVRYAEVLKLRQAILQTQSATKSSQVERRGSK